MLFAQADWQAPTALPDLRRAGLIALDIETKDGGLLADRGSGWPWGDGYICGISAAYRDGGEIRSFYVPLKHPESPNFDHAQVFLWLRDLVASDVRIITQAGLYDFGWLRTEAGILMPPSERIEEIGALATVVDENRFEYGLDALCAWRGLPGKDLSLLKDAAQTFGLPKRAKLQAHLWQLPAKFVGPYAEGDAVATLSLYESLTPVLAREGTHAAYRLEVDLLPMIHEMRRRGIRIDTTAAEQARDQLLQKRDAVFAELSEKLGLRVGMEEIGRNKWLAEIFDQHKIAYPRTKKGNPSFTAGTTGWMHQHEHWLPRLIVKADKYNNAATNFLERFILGHTVKGRVHAEIHPHRSDEGGTRSLRFSYSDPPLQLMPSRDEELTPLIRGVFLPEEGEIWAKPDVSQQEFRFIVHYAAQHKLQRAQEAAERYRLDPAADFHTLTAELTQLDRQSAKAVNFAKAFGAGVKKFAAMIGKPEKEARSLYDQYDRELPFVSRLATICQKQAAQKGFITLYDGARRHWDAFEAVGVAWSKGVAPCEHTEARCRTDSPEHPWYHRAIRRIDTHKAMNALIQGSAARHTKLWMRACWREGIVPLLQMHDALDCSVSSPEQAERVAQLGREAVSLAVPMQVDLKFGRNWADAEHTWAELGAPAPKQVKKSITPPPQAKQPDAPDLQHPGGCFLFELFDGRTQAPIFITSLANDKADKRLQPKNLATRDFKAIADFITNWDRAGRALFFAPSTVRTNRRAKEELVELPALWADLDFKTIVETSDEIQAALEQLPLPPQRVVASGHGLHCYWLFPKALAASPENIARVEGALQQLAGILAGDPLVAQAAALLRVPGSHNSKNKEWTEVKIIASRTGTVTLEQIEQWLATAEPILHQPAAQKGNGHDDDEPLEHVDVDQRLDEMEYQGAGTRGIHQTQLSVTASMLGRGVPVDEAVELVLAATRNAAGAEGERWNWAAEERDLRKMCNTWLNKHPELRWEAPAGEPESPAPAAEPKTPDDPPTNKGSNGGTAPSNGAASNGQQPPKPDPWPVLGAAAYHGLAGQVVNAILPNTESDPVALLLQFHVSFGNAVGRQPYYQVENDRHFANLFTVLVGQSAKSRKGTSVGRIRRIFEIADPDWARTRTLGGMSSGEGVIAAVRDEVRAMRKGVEEVIDPGVEDKRLLLDEREFFQALAVLKREGNILSRVIRDAWDCRYLLATMTKNSPTRATKPFISVIGHITADELRQTLDHTSMANGYANRFLFACVKRSKLLPHGGSSDEDVTEKLGQDTLAAIDAARSIERVTMAAEAAQLWEDVYPRLAEGRPGLIGAITDRAEAQSVRLALLYALLDRSPQIARVHLEAGLAVWAYCDASADFIFGDLVGDPVADTMLRALRRTRMSRNDIINLLGRNVAVSKIEAALSQLLAAGKIRREVEKTSGRPREVWSAV
jgi:DNA polymerase I-like protein with 3'-5' exonuclease and polymerase domains